MGYSVLAFLLLLASPARADHILKMSFAGNFDMDSFNPHAIAQKIEDDTGIKLFAHHSTDTIHGSIRMEAGTRLISIKVRLHEVSIDRTKRRGAIPFVKERRFAQDLESLRPSIKTSILDWLKSISSIPILARDQ